jgi:hypothetical protein
MRGGHAVQLGLEHGSLHGFLTLSSKRKRIVSRQFQPVNNFFEGFFRLKTSYKTMGSDFKVVQKPWGTQAGGGNNDQIGVTSPGGCQILLAAHADVIGLPAMAI